MIIKEAMIKRLVLVRLDTGDDILLRLREAVAKSNIHSGFIMNGLGSAQSYHYHVVADTNLPPKEAFPKGEAALDIVGITGMVIDGRVHAHIEFSDDTKVHGGHLEEGARVLTFTVIAIADLGDLSVTDWDHIGPLPK